MNKRVGYVLSSIFGAVIIALYFFNWINEFGFWDGSLISLGITGLRLGSENYGGILSGFGNYLTIAMIISIILLLLIALAIVSIFVYIIKGAVSGTGHKAWGNTGMIITLFLSLFVSAGPALMGAIDSPIIQLLGSVLGDVTLWVPIVVVVLALLSLIFLNALDSGKAESSHDKYDKNRRAGRYNRDEYGKAEYENTNNYNDDFRTQAVDTTPEKYCPACGGTNPDYAIFCKQCGYNFKKDNTSEPQA